MEIVGQIVEDGSGEGMIAQPFSVDWEDLLLSNLYGLGVISFKGESHWKGIKFLLTSNLIERKKLFSQGNKNKYWYLRIKQQIFISRLLKLNANLSCSRPLEILYKYQKENYNPKRFFSHHLSTHLPYH